MGAALSSDSVTAGKGIGDLPESCVAEVLVRLDPPEVCRLAALSRAFRGASAADHVWEVKLPENYRRLLERAALEEEEEATKMPTFSKKEIYARLSRPNPFDGGNKEFWVDKWSGRLCMSISSKKLAITGIDDRRHWNYIPIEESRFHAVAYLQQIWWFEVDGAIEFPFPAGIYSLSFRLHLGRPSKRLGRRIWSTEQIHGWDIKPVQFQLSTSDGQHVTSRCFLDEHGGWIHYCVGNFVVQVSHVPTTVKFSMKQIDCTHTKGGLYVDCVNIPTWISTGKYVIHLHVVFFVECTVY